MNKRPYGISYDGKPPARFLTKYALLAQKQEQSQPVIISQGNNGELNSGNDEARDIESSTINSWLQCEQKDSMLVKEDQNINVENHEIVEKQLIYVGKFLNMAPNIQKTQRSTQIHQKKAKEKASVSLNFPFDHIMTNTKLQSMIRKQKNHCFWKLKKKKATTSIRCRERWAKRILNCHKILQQDGLSLYQNFRTIKKQDLFQNIEGQQILCRFSSFYQMRFIGHDFKQKIKLVLKVFFYFLIRFLSDVEEVYQIWILDFKSFALAANVYYGWIQEYSQKDTHVLLPVNCKVKEFLLEIYLIFCQWSYSFGYTDQYVTMGSQRFTVHIGI